ncbi:nitrate ABC transporter ATP-binding protein [Achromobacter sp. HZ01]|uniref:ATP-binding cassette domain-containing protein n=1 Tax=Achromobacter sp. HZ01 TaxID=1416886 RepID=UPI000DC53361|nr:ATP-binding cassette domain-containing protein [Achromobacter sp. HZ01]RAP62025.1 nitrate ABC transporter ATP-binding protein [Achromobacter sp. HZ01]
MLEMQSVSLRCGARHVLHDVDLRLRPGERLGLIGPRGAGKTSLLRLAAGLARPSGGVLRNGFRHPLLMFKEPRLLLWRHALENVALPLRASGLPEPEARSVSAYWLRRVGLDAAMESPAAELPRALAQRAALARALALAPDLLMLDRPFNAMEPAARRQLADCCRQAVVRSGAALLCVSDDPDELLGLVDRCALLHRGRLRPVSLVSPFGGSMQADAQRLRELLAVAGAEP